MTVIPYRRPKQKAHINIGHAKNAVSFKVSRYVGAECDMELYELRDGEWSLLWTIPKGTMESELPWKTGAK